MSACPTHCEFEKYREPTHLRKLIGGLLLSVNSRFAVFYPAIARAGTLLQRLIQ